MTSKKLKIAVICDNKEQFENYVCLQDTNKYEFLYFSPYNYPNGTCVDGFKDLRELTRIVIARLSQQWWRNKYKNDKSTNTENS